MKEYKSVGLTKREAQKRLTQYGKNEIKRTTKVNPLKIFLTQFTSPLIVILIFAALISFAIGYLPGQEHRTIDTILIMVIVLISGISGFMQEYKAEKSIEALQKMATPKSTVLRDGKEIEIFSTEIVPGDIIILESGDIIPADATIIESFNLSLDESSLTGESRDVNKKKSDLIFMSSFIYTGTAKAVVIKTGMNTQIGEIASKLQEIKEDNSPFEEEISAFSKKIFWLVAGIIILIFASSIFKYNLYQSLLIAISLAVAAIPEGLPAVVVLALALGAKTMANKNALIRKLSVAESIGAVDIICTDKTGTITMNEMSVTALYVKDKVIETDTLSLDDSQEIIQLFTCAALCNNSRLGESQGNRKYLGDQTEVALSKISEQFGFSKKLLEKKYTKINELSFSSERKMMSVIFKKEKKYLVYSKGAPEILIEKCSKIYIDGKSKKLNDSTKKEILKQNAKFASSGLRVLGFAFKEMPSPSGGEEQNLIWIGLQAMIDPPHKEVTNVLKDCKNAGLRVIMITGDNPLTAIAIANKIGLSSNGVISGSELDHMSKKDLAKKIKEGVNIFARTTPFHKLEILQVLQKKSRIAMTGDGVNDALALKEANVGISMNIKSSEVAKESSDMILLDDNFATIIDSVKEGRRIFDNTRKFINYLFVCNFAEVAVLFFATLFLPLKEPILLPVQLLWINLLTDGMPALALGVDPARKDIMTEPPRRKNEPIINKRLGWLIGTIGFKKTLILFATFFLAWKLIGINEARTTLFTGFILYEFVRIGSIRFQDKLGWLANKWLLAALVGSLGLQLTIIYTPLNVFFGIVPLTQLSWIILIGGSLIGYVSAIGITRLVMKYVKC